MLSDGIVLLILTSMRYIVAFRTFKCPKKAQNDLKLLQKDYFPLKNKAKLYISFGTYLIFKEC